MANIENGNINKKIIKIVSLLMLKRKEDRRGRRACERERDFKHPVSILDRLWKQTDTASRSQIYSRALTGFVSYLAIIFMVSFLIRFLQCSRFPDQQYQSSWELKNESLGGFGHVHGVWLSVSLIARGLQVFQELFSTKVHNHGNIHPPSYDPSRIPLNDFLRI